LSADALLAEAESFIEDHEKLGERAPRGVQTKREGRAPRARASAFLLAWKVMKEQLYIEGRVPSGRLPPFVDKYLRMLWDTNEWTAMRALAIGDVPFFIGWLFRLDQIDVAMIDAGLTLGDRTPIIRYRAAIDGYRQVAEKRLHDLGGVWPPVTRTEAAAATAPRKRQKARTQVRTP